MTTNEKSRQKMILKQFRITRDFRVSVACARNKVTVYFWASRKGASFKMTKQEFMELLTKTEIVKAYIEGKQPSNQ